MTAAKDPIYGHDLRFGVVLTPDAGRPARTVELAVRAERAGLDLVSVSDHQYRPDLLEAWTALSWIAARTRRVSVLPDVANLLLRPPAGLARAAASLNLLSDGRVELGLGAGGYGPASYGEGGPDLSVGDRIAAFEEAVRVIRALTSPGGPVSIGGRFHTLHDAVPSPTHPHRIGLWIGAVAPRMLRLTGRLGDGWIPSATRIPPSDLDAAQEQIDRAAAAAGRDPRSIRRLYNLPAVPGVATDSWADRLTRIVTDHGISGFLVFTDDPDMIARFGEEVAPRVREAVR